jgi:hypothetical protein
MASGAVPVALVARLTTPEADVGTVYFTTLDNKVRKVGHCTAGLSVLAVLAHV